MHFLVHYSCTDLEGVEAGDTDPPPPPEKSQNIGFLSNTGPDPLKNHKATKLDSSSTRR